MSRDIVYIGPVPCNEDCQQVGPGYDSAAARAECQRYISDLRRHYGAEPEGARLSIKSEPHDFGSYLEVVCRYDDENEAAVNYAFRVEEGMEAWLPSADRPDDMPLPEGWTWEMVEEARAKWDISPNMVPVAAAPGCVAWGTVNSVRLAKVAS